MRIFWKIKELKMKTFNFSYDEIYGIDLNEYLKRQNKKINDLINEIETDINILKDNMRKNIYVNNPNWILIGEIHKVIVKKENHLRRLKEWKNEFE